MLDETHIINILNKCLQDKDKFKDQHLPTVIFFILKPFVNKKQNLKNIQPIIDQILKSCNICTRCQYNIIKTSSDVFCKTCKSIIKDNYKTSMNVRF